ncbi:MAG: esterase [Deltaproteobacteria bacterium]|nr:MAG: esterase [Deltaproteobacteria bacterium]
MSARAALVALWLSGCAVGEYVALEHDGESRNYYLASPEGLDEAPLLLVMHGGGPAGRRKGRRMGAFTGLAALAESEGFVAAFPSSLAGNWNDGRELDAGYVSADTDDAGFLLAVIDDVAERASIDPSRVYVSGISNGGFMTQRMLCEHADRFAAGVSVIATMPTTLTCAPSTPVPVRFVLGTEDPLVPWEGGEVAGGDRGEALSADTAFAFWRAHNQCTGEPVSTELPDADPEDGTTARVERAQDCAAPTERVVLDGGGHTWPGGVQYLPERTVGRVSHDVDGAELVWGFVSEQVR